MTNTIDLKNKVVLITGGASGAGFKYVKYFAQTSCDIAFTYHRKTNDVQSLITELSPKIRIKAYKIDFNDISSIKDTVNQIENDFGQIDVLINNAGIYPSKEIHQIEENDWDEMFAINTKATFFINRFVSDVMNKNKGGSIINISSINATNPNINLLHYGSSKAAVEHITKNLAVSLGEKVRVNCIAPGLIYRENIEKDIPKWVTSYKERSPLKRLVECKDIANTAIFLASDLSSGITGQIITVDCGITLSSSFDYKE